MFRYLPIPLLVAAALAVAAPTANASGMSAGKVSYSDLSVMISLEKGQNLIGTGKTMAAEVIA